jgi:hypothetical protein
MTPVDCAGAGLDSLVQPVVCAAARVLGERVERVLDQQARGLVLPGLLLEPPD